MRRRLQRFSVFKGVLFLALAVGSIFAIDQLETDLPRSFAGRSFYSQPDAHSQLTSFPIVGQQNPDVKFLIDNYGEEEAVQLLARYDVIIVNRSVIKAEFESFWDEVFAKNGELFLVWQWSSWDRPDCSSVDPSVAAFGEHIKSLGGLAGKIDAVELDATGSMAGECGQDTVKRAIGDYGRELKKAGLSAALTSNGSNLQIRDSKCDYEPGVDSTGSVRFAEQPGLVNGVLEEGWLGPGIRKYFLDGDLRGFDKAKSRMDESCGWLNNSKSPAFVWAHHEIGTPWWSNKETDPKVDWKNMRLGFAGAQMFNNVAFIYNPTKSGDEDRAINAERLFWGDYYAVDMETGATVSYGRNRIGSRDDDTQSQLVNGGYLGNAVSDPKVENRSRGAFYSREFECGYVYANISPQESVVNPAVKTRKVKGVQDPGVDNGESQSTYTVPGGDGLVLLKESCLPGAGLEGGGEGDQDTESEILGEEGFTVSSIGEDSAFRGRITDKGEITLFGKSQRVGGTRDKAHFVWKNVGRVATIRVKLEQLEANDTSVRAGLMIRSSLDPEAESVSVLVVPRERGARFLVRAAKGDRAETIKGLKSRLADVFSTPPSPPLEIVLEKRGAKVEAYLEKNSSRAFVGEASIEAIEGGALVGLVHRSPSENLGTSTFSGFIIE